MKHLVATRRYIHQMIEAGHVDLLGGGPWTKESALEALKNDPREYFSPCDNTGPDGDCLGHPERPASVPA